jgi:TonB family protein
LNFRKLKTEPERHNCQIFLKTGEFMKKTFLLTCVVCLLNLAAFAQNKTDFSGDWELDTVKSKLDERMRVESMTMKVAQTEKELKVTTVTKRAMPTDGGGTNRGGGMMGGGSGEQTLTYSLDGKETKAEVGSGMMAGTATLKASLDTDGKLKLSSTREITTQMGAMTIKTKETWELADGGKTLKVSRETESPRGTNSSELVFTKKETAAADTPAVPGSTSPTPTPKIISAGVINSKAKNLVKPEYPSAARAVRASGAVNVEVTFDEKGDVISATAVSGHPLLRGAAEDAAKRSKFEPVLLQGVPIKVSGIIVYNFVAP